MYARGFFAATTAGTEATKVIGFAVSHPRNVPANVAQLQVGGWN